MEVDRWVRAFPEAHGYFLQAMTPEIVSPLLWTQLLMALVVGLLMAFGFQILLTNLGMVLGLSAFTKRWAQARERIRTRSEQDTVDRPPSSGSIAPVLGFGLLLTVNLVLFAACFLGTRFSQVQDPTLGAIAGLTIWSAYLLILLWLSTRTLNAVAGFVFDRATGGIRWAVGAIAKRFTEDPTTSIPEDDIRNLIRHEIQTTLGSIDLSSLVTAQIPAFTTFADLQDQVQGRTPDDKPAQGAEDAMASSQPESPPMESEQVPTEVLWQPIQHYILETSSKNLTSKQMHRKLEKLLRSAVVEIEPIHQTPPSPPWEKVHHWLEQRPDLSQKKKQRMITEMESIWGVLVLEYGEAEATDQDAIDQAARSGEEQVHHSQGETDWIQEKLQETFPTILKQAIDYAVTNLDISDFLNHSKQSIPKVSAAILGTTLVGLADALKQVIQSGTFEDSMALNVATIKPSVEKFFESARLNLTDLSQTSIDHILEQAEQIRHRATSPFETMQNRIQSRVDELRQEAYKRAESAQRQAVKALWWLFAIASTGALSSALAGTLATPSAWNSLKHVSSLLKALI